MHLPRFKRLINRLIAEGPEPLLLYGLVFSQLFLLCQLLELRLTTPATILLISGLPLLMTMLYYAARHAHSPCFHMTLLMVVFAHYGILLGVMLDFGPQGLLILAGLCGSFTGLSPELLWSIARIAPWTFIGMLLGSNLGMLLSSRMLSWDARSNMSNMIIYPVCNLGMLAGMVLTEMLIPTTTFTSDARMGVVAMILLMLLGMSLGMLLSWWLAKRLSTLLSMQRLISHGATP